ncbi:LOW QUALITY PROTEIN: hypothetical protein Cgig2_001304 [Carnegiea gigantea]|uniref:Uncharacterized protein n=1 Tax=Carnegiea gigantea TaxID=171969 RepID=A0A9Q1JTL9_9CARY|nr:LOW QUALITY PROTEIN: hypothetical protein Cgig2_001304 [Carnegiea gigantea]
MDRTSCTSEFVSQVSKSFPEGAENLMDILDAEPNPIEYMQRYEFQRGIGTHSSAIVNSILSVDWTNTIICGLRLDGLKGVCSSKDDVESIHRANAPSLVPCSQYLLRVDKNAAWVFGKGILDKVSRTRFDGLPSLEGVFDILYATILQRGVDVTPLESKVKGLIKQACDFKDLQ